VFARRRAAFIAAALVAAATRHTHAQAGSHVHPADSTPRLAGSVRLHALALVSRVDPAMGGGTYTEAYLAQPMLMGRGSALRGRLEGILTLDFEGLTLGRGQLTPGAYGEGYADRRHPHTYLHEAVVVARGAFGRTGVSLAGGKGFVPFGTDDPMMRPFAAYPVNHHLAQILERYVVTAAVRRSALAVEAALFNGDEPASPGAPPDADRFGDSWAARVTASSRRGIELQGSYAFVTSPEIAGGGGLDQHKWSAAVRLERDRGAVRYALLEWAWADAVLGDVSTNRFSSVLGEASTELRSVTLSMRYENTTRPEEQRLLDPFRTSRSPTDLSIIGITRWQTVSGAASVTRSFGAMTLAPFVEATYARPTQAISPSAFEPAEFYGASAIWMLSAGVRVGVGPMLHRMGRYGVAMPNVMPASRHTTRDPALARH
jgi:hypothetical protein